MPSEPLISDVADTALWVAAVRAGESARKDALFKDPFAAKLSGERGRAIVRDVPYPKITAWILAVRTVVIDRFIAEAIASGVDTVVNIGTGLDTRPYRLELPDSLNWVEIDVPKIIDLKSAGLAREVPRCKLRRIAVDFSVPGEAARLYAEVGALSKKALVITEGVIPYLTNDEAGQLARDLAQVPSFHFWIQDYHNSRGEMRRPKKLRERLKNAPFKFQHPDALAFFAERGWKVRADVNAIEEGRRLGRPFPIPFPFGLLVPLLPEKRRAAFRSSMGYAMLERN